MARYDDDDDPDDRPASRRRRYDDEDDERDEGRGRRRYDDEEEDHDFREREQPHSGLGIASLIVAVFSGVLLLIVVGFAAVMAEEFGDLDEDSPTVMLLGAFALGACALTLLGLGLGVGGLIQKDRNKVFAILGVLANGFVLMGASTLLCAGVMMGG
jgi:hypothetical protein